MADDNEKFLNKFKNQISKMGKEGILGKGNYINLTTNKNNLPNNASNNKPKVIFNNCLSDKNTKRKGSAFLRPINKPKINLQEQSKNNPSNNITTKNNTQNNAPPINYWGNYHPLYYPNQTEMMYNPPLYFYQNPYFFQNNFYNQQKINNPYYYYQQNNNVDFQPTNINNNNIQNTNENNNNNHQVTNKKKLRPISAQNISKMNNTTINSNYNKNNITTYTNCTTRCEYKPYTLKDYKEIVNVDTLGGLGANIGTEEWEKKKEKMDKMSEYAKNLLKRNKNKSTGKIKTKNNKDEISTRKRANEYSKLIRPKSTGNIKIIKPNRGLKNIPEQNEDIININIIQGKNDLIHKKNILAKKDSNNNDENEKMRGGEEKLKDIFNNINFFQIFFPLIQNRLNINIFITIDIIIIIIISINLLFNFFYFIINRISLFFESTIFFHRAFISINIIIIAIFIIINF